MVMLDRSACTRAVRRGYLADCPGDEVGSESRMEKLKIFSPEQNGVQFLQFCQGRDLIGAHI